MALVFTQTECSQSQPGVSSSIQARLTGGGSCFLLFPSHRRFVAARDRRRFHSFSAVAEHIGSRDALEECHARHSAQGNGHSLQVSSAAPSRAHASPATGLLPPAGACGTLGGEDGGGAAGVATSVGRERTGATTHAGGASEPAGKRDAQFLERVAKDVLGELEAGRGQQTPVKRRQEEKIQTPIRTSQKRLPDDLVSPSKGRQDQPRVSEDTVKRVKVAIEKDNGISYLVKTKQSLPFDKLVSCVRVFVWYRA